MKKLKTEMGTKIKFHFIVLILILLISCKSAKENFWIQDCAIDDIESCGFKNTNGELEIEYGKYQMIFTDTFRKYAIVLKEKEGFVGIDRNEKTLFKVFNYDNGPDYVSENFFRIEENGKIGFVNHQTGQITIKPKFSAARPFENGYAAICQDCETKFVGEHSIWVNGKWGLISKKGEIIIEPKFEEIQSITKNNRVTIIENGIEKQIEIKRMQ